MKKAQILSIVAGAMVAGSVLLPWLEAENLDLYARGLDLRDGLAAAIVGIIAIAFGVGTFIRRSKTALIVNDVISALIVFGLLSHAFWYAPQVLSETYGIKVELEEWIIGGWGYYLAMLGGVLSVFAAAVAYGARPEYDLGTKVLRVEARWNDAIIKEQVFLEPAPVTVGEDLRCNFVVPDAPLGRRFTLFKPDPRGRVYSAFFTREMQGQLCINGEVSDVDEFVRAKTSNVDGPNQVELSDKDFGFVRFGPLELIWRFVRPERQIARVPFWRSMDRNVAAALLVSMVLQMAFLVWALLSWDETAVRKRRNQARQMLQVAVEVETLEEEILEMEGEEDTSAKQAEGDEGKFGDPEEDLNKESKVPKRDGEMVNKIDPKKVGLNDLLSSDKLGGVGAISDILAANDGLSNKLAVAMSGSGTEFALGHGSGGLGFKGTGTGGGGEGGYGRIHGLGKVDTGGGTAVRANLGKKRVKKVGKMKMGAHKAAGFCAKGNITSVVRRRAGAIRACYEDRLQVKPKLEGKITVRWRIGLDGRVETASVASTSLKDSKVESCVLRAVRRMRFQKPDGGICVIQWPFVFRSGG